MIVVQAAPQTSKSLSWKTERELEQNGKHKLYIRNKHTICLLNMQNVPRICGFPGLRQGGYMSVYFSFSTQM